MSHVAELLASCVAGVPDCDDTTVSAFQAPAVIAVLAVLLCVGFMAARSRRR